MYSYNHNYYTYRVEAMNLLVVTPLPLVWWRPHTPAPPFQLKHLTLAHSWRNSHHSLIKLQVEWWVLGQCYTHAMCRHLVLTFTMMYFMVWLVTLAVWLLTLKIYPLWEAYSCVDIELFISTNLSSYVPAQACEHHATVLLTFVCRSFWCPKESSIVTWLAETS